jgi:uncharacterized surface protein with fasciclin (FAS1) repeats
MVLVVLFSCDDPYKDDTFQAYDVYPTATYLDTRSEDFSMWIEILHFADLYNAINQASMTFTSFVPDNEAVKNFLESKGVASIEGLGEEYARQLVQYHIINAEVAQKEFLLGGKLTTPTVSGDYLSVSFDESGEGGLNSVYVNNEALVTELANKTTNGLVYALDAVLTPLVETMYDRLSENNNYSIFKEAVEMTGWKSRLDTPYDTVYSEYGSVSYIKKNFTLFVVSDDVFAAQGISDVNGLAGTLGAGSDYTSDENALRRYVGYHLLGQTHYAEDLFPFDAADSTIIWTVQTANEVLSTNSTGGNFYLNYTQSSGAGIKLVDGKSDIQAKNGIIHEVDGLMPVMSPDPMTVVWDLCSYDDVESVVNAYGAANNLGDIYQTYQSAEKQITFSDSEISSYVWKSYSSSSAWPRLGYLVTKANSGATVNTYGAYLNDMLLVNLGYLGNVAMKTPVILKGKYKVELYYACAGSLSDFINGGSKCKFSLDSQSQEVYVYDGAKASVGIYSLTMFSEIEFDGTTQHDFKLVLLDSRATSHANYRLQLDYVKFTPVFE